MGERQRRRQRFFREHPFCCFCGGGTPATEIDHVPSRQMFTLKQRPSGLEVPACKACNVGTSQHEQVASLFSRMYPGPATRDQHEETIRIIDAVIRSCPDLANELRPASPEQRMMEREPASFQPTLLGISLGCSGHEINRSLKIFGAKLGFALHYHCTDRIVPTIGGVGVRWFSNYDAITGRIPDEIYKVLGPRCTLRQGTWNVGEQFSYASWIADGTAMVAYYSSFRLSFAVVSLVSEDAASFAGVESTFIHRPRTFYD